MSCLHNARRRLPPPALATPMPTACISAIANAAPLALLERSSLNDGRRSADRDREGRAEWAAERTTPLSKVFQKTTRASTETHTGRVSPLASPRDARQNP